MRKASRILCVLLVMLTVFTSMPIAFAKTEIKTVLSEEDFYLTKETNQRKFTFSITEKAFCFIEFSGWEDYNYNGYVSGEKIQVSITVLDAAGRKVVSKISSDTIYEDEFFLSNTFSETLPKGKYTLVLTLDSDHPVYVDECIVNAELPKTSSKVITIKQGQSKQLNVYSEVTNKKILWGEFDSWTSSNESVATVSWKGVVTGKSIGETVIECVYDDIDSMEWESVYTVTIRVNKAKTQLYYGESKSLQSLLKNVKNYKSAKWSSADPSIVSVTKAGKATAKKTGKTTLSAKVNGTTYTVETTVPKVKLSQTTLSLVAGRSKKLTITAPAKMVTWSSSNKAVATVSSSGNVKAKKSGSATITAKYNGKNYTCKVTVRKAAYGKIIGTILAEYKKGGVYDFYADTGAKVYIIDPANNAVLASATVDASGNYVIPNVLAGTWVAVIVSGHAHRSSSREEEETNVYGINIEDEAYTDISVTVKAKSTIRMDEEFISLI